MNYPRILAAIRSAKWAVTPATLHAIRDTLSARMQGRMSARARAQEEADYGDPDQPKPFEMVGPGVAAVQMRGIIGKNLSQLEMDCGGCDIGMVEQNLRTALADVSVGAVLLCIDSPGGTVNGVAEFASRIESLSAATGKPVVAFADGQACSAAYWLACGCSAIFCTPSSDVGSIGVYMALIDESENWAQEGFKLVLIKAGDFKAAGIPGSQITDEQIALWQGEVSFIYEQFKAVVRAARPSVADPEMQGQSFYGPLALDAGLVDGVVNSMADVLGEFAAAAPLSPPAAAAPAAIAATSAAAVVAPAASAAPVAPVSAMAPITLNITLPQMSFAAPNITTNVDARLEKDSISVTQTQGSTAKKITRDDKGNITGTEAA